jgi:NAD(P)-dependent dehydrogenase (short-subunit alcohol dehydrogenase family)
MHRKPMTSREGTLAGEIAVVTGARHGIGEGIARALAAAGARVAVTHHDPAAAVQVAMSLGPDHIGVDLDVRSTQSIEAAALTITERLGAVTILINSAGINRVRPAESFSDEDWHAVMDVNLTGTQRCCRAFGKRMLMVGRGCIVNIASIVGPEVAMPGRAAYAASKAGVVGLTRVLGVEWAGRGVRVNALVPGPVRTAMVERGIAEGVLVESDIVDHTPAGRLGETTDIAQAVILLCSREAGFITAQTLVVDGGYSMYGAARPASHLPVTPKDDGGASMTDPAPPSAKFRRRV